jgi:hypothetical protein
LSTKYTTMISSAATVSEYMNTLPEERKAAMQQLRATITAHLPAGFEETMSYGMIGYVIPLSSYPNGYHCKANEPLPLMNIASQKNFIALYHMGIYGSPELLAWFQAEYPKHCSSKLDMGKSCIRFKKMDQSPYALIAQLCEKLSPEAWIAQYESILKR